MVHVRYLFNIVLKKIPFNTVVLPNVEILFIKENLLRKDGNYNFYNQKSCFIEVF